MAGRRKLWSTRYDFVGAELRRHESRAALDRWIDQQVGLWKRGVLRSHIVRVYVDNREGAGRQLFERIDLVERAQAEDHDG